MRSAQRGREEGRLKMTCITGETSVWEEGDNVDKTG